MKNQKKTMLVLMIVQTLVFLFIFSYAWFASDFDPVIYSGDLRIASTKGLEIQLEDLTHADESEIEDEVNIKDIEKDLSEYRLLSQVSSADGVTMYRRLVEDDSISYVEVPKEEKDYIDVTIKLLNKSNDGGKDRDVFIESLDLTFLDENGNRIDNIPNYVYDSLRISLEVEEPTGNNVYIMGFSKISNGGLTRYDEYVYEDFETVYQYNGIEQDSGFTQYSSTNVISSSEDGYILHTAIGSSGLSNETNPLVQAKVLEKDPTAIFGNRFMDQNVKFLNIFLKEYPGRTNITSIPSGQGKKITFRLWLEGADPRCNSNISGSSISLKLVFGSELRD